MQLGSCQLSKHTSRQSKMEQGSTCGVWLEQAVGNSRYFCYSSLLHRPRGRLEVDWKSENKSREHGELATQGTSGKTHELLSSVSFGRARTPTSCTGTHIPLTFFLEI